MPVLHRPVEPTVISRHRGNSIPLCCNFFRVDEEGQLRRDEELSASVPPLIVVAPV